MLSHFTSYVIGEGTGNSNKSRKASHLFLFVFSEMDRFNASYFF